jgi:hypothetical protein
MNFRPHHTTATKQRVTLILLAGLLGLLNGHGVRAANRVVAWGDNFYGQTNVPPAATNVIAVAAGGAQSLALRSDGTVMSWGHPARTAVPGDLSNVVAIAAGDGQNLALKSDGSLVAWGAPSNAQLTNVPPGLSNIVAIAAGDSHNLVLRADGTIYAWGSNFSGQTNVPAGLSNVVAIAAGNTGILAVKSDGTVWGSRAPTNIINSITNAVAGAIVASGGQQGAIIMADGTAVAWGYPGNGGVTNISNVTAVCGRSGFNQAGAVWALRRDETLTGLGSFYLGDTNVYQNLSNVIAIAIGYNHHLAIVGDGLPLPPTVLANPVCGPNRFSIQQPTVRGLSYRLEFKNSLTDSNWRMLPPVPGDNTTRTLVDPNPSDQQRLYRVRVTP